MYSRGTILLLVLVLAVPAAAQAPLADRLPAESLAYMGWAGATDAFNASAPGQLLGEPALADLLASLHKSALENLSRKEGESFKLAWEMGRLAWRHPAALTVTALKAAGGEPQPQMAILVDLGKDRAAFSVQFDALINAHLPPMQDAQEGAVAYKTVDAPPGPISTGYMGDTFFFAIGKDIVKQLLAVKPESSLASNARFAGAVKQVTGADVLTISFVDLPAIVKAVDSFIPAPASESAPAAGATPAAGPMKKFVAALGLGRTQLLVSCTRVLKPGLYTRTRIISPAPHQGLLGVLAAAPLKADALADVPADADIAVAANISLLALWREMLGLVQAVPDAPLTAESIKAMVQASINLAVEEDLLATLGDSWTMTSAPSLGGFLTGTVVWADVKDSPRLQQSLDSLCSRFLAAPTTQPARRSRGPQLMVSNAGNVKYIGFAPDVVPVAPAWTIQNNRLYMALFPQVVAAAMQKPAASLAENPKFLQYRRLVSPKASMISYVECPRILQEVYPLILTLGTAGANEAAGEGINLRPGMLPSLLTMQKYVSPAISALSSDEGGVTTEDYCTLPMGNVLSSVLNMAMQFGFTASKPVRYAEPIHVDPQVFPQE
ncbi:MAG: DUF3352 domain-containing protein [Planctomycetaceae bacterium]|nr:DUF3352 domain-containing protein [Planctomycetaceae bacterium]